MDMNKSLPERTIEDLLERVITIDGRGRPLKARLLLDLIKRYGINEVTKVLKEFGERKHF